MSDFKKTIIDALDLLRRKEESNRAYFKVKAYKKVIEELRLVDRPIQTIDDLDGMPGVGAAIKKKIVEILETGHLVMADEVMVELDAVAILTGVYGIGIVKAKSLIADGIKTIPALREAVAKNPKLLNDKQKIGLQYYEDLLERIPRTEMKALEKVLLGNMTGRMKGVVVGSYRRGAADSGDVDVLLTMPNGPAETRIAAFREYVERLKSSGFIVEMLTEGDQKCFSIVKLKPTSKSRRLDLLVVPNEEYACSLLYFTGSGDFNVAFRKHALSLGYTLNEHELKPTGRVEGVAPVPPFKYEAEIFAFLGLKYKDPHQRTGASAIVELTEETKAKVRTSRKSKK
jgi:DNA polymerase/3'-5' exonuclease PolX